MPNQCECERDSEIAKKQQQQQQQQHTRFSSFRRKHAVLRSERISFETSRCLVTSFLVGNLKKCSGYCVCGVSQVLFDSVWVFFLLCFKYYLRFCQSFRLVSFRWIFVVDIVCVCRTLNKKKFFLGDSHTIGCPKNLPNPH